MAHLKQWKFFQWAYEKSTQTTQTLVFATEEIPLIDESCSCLIWILYGIFS